MAYLLGYLSARYPWLALPAGALLLLAWALVAWAAASLARRG